MKPKVRKALVVLLLIGLFLGGGSFGMLLWRIHQSVERYCTLAQQAYPHPGDNTASLIDFARSDAPSFQERNLAIWTLGRLRDARALPALNALYTGEVCDHERKVCQYELEKAIKRCGEIPNPPRKTREDAGH